MKCPQCSNDFGSEDALQMHTKSKHFEAVKRPTFSTKTKKKIRNWGIALVVLLLVVGGPIYLLAGAETLPPTSMQGHIEENPPSQVMLRPIDLAVQKHMLEHAGGKEGGRGGVIINYNCFDYTCETDLIDKLEAFTEEYDYVYVAPFKGMDAKIALTKLGRIEVLENYDEQKIKRFIG